MCDGVSRSLSQIAEHLDDLVFRQGWRSWNSAGSGGVFDDAKGCWWWV